MTGMFNWIFNNSDKLDQIIRRLSSGKRIGQLITAIIAACIGYLSIQYLQSPISSYFSGDTSTVNGVLVLGALGVLVVCVIIAFVNFSRWISDHEDMSDEQIIAEAKRDTNQQLDTPEDLIKHIK